MSACFCACVIPAAVGCFGGLFCGGVCVVGLGAGASAEERLETGCLPFFGGIVAMSLVVYLYSSAYNEFSARNMKSLPNAT